MVLKISLSLLLITACAAQIVVNPSGGGTGGATGPTGPAGALAVNAEAAGPLVQDSSFCPVYARTLTSGSALITLNTPVAGCWISVQNNTSSTFTVNGATNGITVNGSVQNLTQPGCTDLTKACPGVIIKANGTTSWDVSGWSVGPAGATGATGPTGPTGPTGATGATGSPGVGSSYSSNKTPVTATANTTADQPLQEVSLAAGILNTAGAPFLLHGSGIFTIAAIQTPTLTFKVKLCTISGCGSGTVVTLATIATAATVAATNNPFNLNLKLLTITTGATGTVLAHGPLAIDIGAVATLADTVYSDINTAASGGIDLTAALFLDFTVATSAGNAGNSFTQQLASLEPASSIGATGPTGATGPSAVVFSGTAALGTSAIASATCATVVTATATGALTTDTVSTVVSGDLTAVAGYIPSASGVLAIYPPWLTAGQFNVKVCNNTAGSIIPGAVTLIFKVVR